MKTDSRIFAALGAAALLTGLAGAPAMADTPAAPSAGHAGGEGHWAMFEQYCNDCHNTEDWAGGVAFDVLTEDDIGSEAEVFEKVVRKLRSQQMPP
ncbi:MAG: hypothetical protein DIU62_012075, partial [Pseudomonadota bacterium]